MDLGTAATVGSVVVSVAGLIWGIVSFGFTKKTEEEEDLELSTRLDELEKWKASVTVSIETLRRDIEHVREISDIKDEAANDRLKRMEQKLDELLELIISIVKERG